MKSMGIAKWSAIVIGVSALILPATASLVGHWTFDECSETSITDSSDCFGNAMAAVEDGRVLIGAYKDDTGATDAGTACLFSAPSAVAPLRPLFDVNNERQRHDNRSDIFPRAATMNTFAITAQTKTNQCKP
jgi:hypothetical protein